MDQIGGSSIHDSRVLVYLILCFSFLYMGVEMVTVTAHICNCLITLTHSS